MGAAMSVRCSSVSTLIAYGGVTLGSSSHALGCRGFLFGGFARNFSLYSRGYMCAEHPPQRTQHLGQRAQHRKLLWR
jgi:hypothetical protein